MKDSIGYAIFGSPRGLQVVSNGLFKTLQLDSSLYLNHEHIVLEEGEQVLMLRRIATTSNNSIKDGILVVIYQHAWPHGEKRGGGFVGSAICFKPYLPNAQKMAEGLWYLFSEACKQVGRDNRFLSADSTTWNIELPNASQDFGFLNSHKWQHKFQQEPQRVALNTTSLQNDTPSILYNLCFNANFHKYDHVYAADSDVVYTKLRQSSMGSVAFPDLFDYSHQIQAATAQYNNLKQDIFEREAEIHQLEMDYQPKVGHLKKLTMDIQLRNDDIRKLEEAINDLRSEYLEEIDPKYKKDLTDKYQGLKKAIEESEIDIEKKKEVEAELNRAIQILKQQRERQEKQLTGEEKDDANTIAFAAREIIKYYTPEKNYDDTDIIKSYFLSRDESYKTREKQLRFRFRVLVGLIALILLLGAFLAIEKFRNNPRTAKLLKISEQNINQLQNEVTALNAQKDSLADFQKINKNSSQANLQNLRQITDRLLSKFLAGDMLENSPKHTFIINYGWEFWEFDYTNTTLTSKLQSPHQDTYFVDLGSKKLKEFSETGSLTWAANGSLGSLIKYMKEDNDIYQLIAYEDDHRVKTYNDNIPSNLILAHFEWMLEQFNKNKSISELKPKEKIKAPYFKK